MTPRRTPTQIAKVRESLTREVLRAIMAAKRQTSIRQLARDAGVSSQLLNQLQRGDFHVTPGVAKRVADVVARWGADYQTLARRVRAAARRVPNLRTERKP